MSTTTARPRGLGKRARLLTRVLRSILIGLAKFRIFNVIVINREVVPRSGPIIIASNHISIADPIYLWGALRRSAVAMAMAELWRMPVVSWVMRVLGHIPVERGNRESGEQATQASKTVLEHGGALVIFPEGKCSRDGSLLPLKPGVARVSFETGVPVIPSAVTGTNLVKPLKYRRINRSALVIVRFGEPLYPHDYASIEEFLAALTAAISDLLRASQKAYIA